MAAVEVGNEGGVEISIDLSVFYFSRVDHFISHCASAFCFNDGVALEFEVVVLKEDVDIAAPNGETCRQC